MAVVKIGGDTDEEITIAQNLPYSCFELRCLQNFETYHSSGSLNEFRIICLEQYTSPIIPTPFFFCVLLHYPEGSQKPFQSLFKVAMTNNAWRILAGCTSYGLPLFNYALR